MRRNAKIDGTHRIVVDALRAGGCEVQSLATVGNGCADLLISRHGRWHVAEVKAKKGKLRESQVAWIALHGAPVYLLRGVDDVVDFLRQA